jgi:hypothetical protein
MEKMQSILTAIGRRVSVPGEPREFLQQFVKSFYDLEANSFTDDPKIIDKIRKRYPLVEQVAQRLFLGDTFGQNPGGVTLRHLPLAFHRLPIINEKGEPQVTFKIKTSDGYPRP